MKYVLKKIKIKFYHKNNLLKDIKRILTKIKKMIKNLTIILISILPLNILRIFFIDLYLTIIK